MELWEPIPEFWGYSISNHGRVRNDNTGRILAIMRNPLGVCYVGMNKGKKQYRRSLGLLVCRAFVSRPDVDRRNEFNQPIHLDGDQTNNFADNLMWRPHWFAVRYAIQHKRGPSRDANPVVDLATMDYYERPWDACLKFGLIELDLIQSCLNRTYVFPTFQTFRFAE